MNSDSDTSIGLVKFSVEKELQIINYYTLFFIENNF